MEDYTDSQYSEDSQDDNEQSLSLSELEKSDNIAELLDEEELSRIAIEVMAGYELDFDSCAEWRERVKCAMEIAHQTMETKNHPFPNSSNIKYPLITRAAIDFAARMYPEVIKNNRVVKVHVVGGDPSGEKLKRAKRIATYMSYQTLDESDEWEDGLDRLLHMLPILGTVFRKTYYNPIKKSPCHELCRPDKLTVNYNTKSLLEAQRITQEIVLSQNSIIERVRAGLFCDIELANDDTLDTKDEVTLLEQHCFLDLDDDGYKEPYIVILHKATRKILRIVSRFDQITKNREGEIQCITATQYFTDYHCIRSFDGGFYSQGFGTLLYPLNSAINTLTNQLIDSGTLNNTQGGFLGRGLRMKTGDLKLKLGEWRVLDAASGTNLHQNIVPLPTKEPSGALFQLLNLLIEVSKDLVSANDPMSGKGQTQNVAAGSVNAMIDQGMKVFNAISKRLYRSLRSEFNKIFEINKKYLKQVDYQMVLDDVDADVKLDFNTTHLDVLPVADPSQSSELQRITKAQIIMQMPGIDQHEAAVYFLEALPLETQVITKLLPKPDPNQPPPPADQKDLAQAEFFHAQAQQIMSSIQTDFHKQSLDAASLDLKHHALIVNAQESQARIAKMQADANHGVAKITLAGMKADHNAKVQDINQSLGHEKDSMALALQGMEIQNKDHIAERKLSIEEKKLENDRSNGAGNISD